jgi:Protein of unknown function (DUF3592)
MTRLLSVLILTAVTFAKAATAGVEFRESTITSELEKVPAGTTVTVNVVLKNTGDKPANGTDVRIRLPLAGFLVRIDELPELKRDDEEREVSASLDIPAGGEYRFSFDLLASRTKVGKELASHIEVVYLLDQMRWNSDFSTRITNAPSTAGVVIGGLRFHPAAGWLLGWMVCSGVMFVWTRARLQWVREHSKSYLVPEGVRRMPAFGIVAIVVFPLAFLMALGAMAWLDMQTLTSWKESQAIILDRRVDVEVGKTEWYKNGRRKPSSVTRTPEFALKYQAGDREVISSGFITGPSIHVGLRILGKSEYDEWVPGKTIPCWYDPSDPGIVVVQRGFGAKYIVFGLFFGLVPLVILSFGIRQLRKLSAGVRRLNASETER